MSALGHKGHFAMRERCPPCPRKRTFAVQKQMSVDMSRKAAPVAAFQIMWLTTAGTLLRAAIFLAFPHITNMRTTFAVAGICFVFFSGISRCCDEHRYCQGSEQSCKQFHCFPRECFRSTSLSVATCTKSNKAEHHAERRLSPCGLAGF